MGKKGKKKKAGVAAEAGVALTAEQRYSYYSLQVETLERELQVKSAQSEEALRREIELKSKVDQMETDFEDEKSTTFAVTADMARQYKALQEDLIGKINSLETQLTEQKEELDITKHELRELIRNKDDDIEHKDNSIRQLNEQMEDMSKEFAQMLSETLKLMNTALGEKLADGGEDAANKSDFSQRLVDLSDKVYSAVSVPSRPALGDKGASGAGDLVGASST
eukprot:TRINITY_DN48670_c0_g1_i1.p1 TRINITY_DN48670_c0_g1~~TRINITY_DN48670_c0_g1_i1.p1  ORF type:complete len:223 (-),score=66.93 TRINITY_DN48670_c0_g1_i1:158-826(-)